MIETQHRSLEAEYADAIELEKAALRGLQAHEPGTAASAQAWQAWSAAISRTNRAWRQLSCYSLARLPAASRRAAAQGAGAASK